MGGGGLCTAFTWTSTLIGMQRICTDGSLHTQQQRYMQAACQVPKHVPNMCSTYPLSPVGVHTLSSLSNNIVQATVYSQMRADCSLCGDKYQNLVLASRDDLSAYSTLP